MPFPLFLLPLAAVAARKLTKAADRWSSAPAYRLIASGPSPGRTLEWAVVPPSDAAAFRARHPNAMSARDFLEVVDGMAHTQPDEYQGCLPFVGQLIGLLRAHPGSAVFVVPNN